MHPAVALVAAAAALALAGPAEAAAPQAPGPASAPGKPVADRVARGRYLVEGVGMCADCHSPRGERGEFVKAEWLWGAPLGMKADPPIPGWAPVAPPIAGLPGWTDAQAVRLLRTGQNRDGRRPAPPMPEYRLSKGDAEAVVAYLRSLPAPPERAR